MTTPTQDQTTPGQPQDDGGWVSVFVRRPILAMVLNLLVIIAGIAAVQSIEIRELPDVDRPVVTVRSSYPGDLYCHVTVETPVRLTEHQRKLMKELDESLKKGGERHSPNAKSWTDRVKDLFK